MIFPTADPWRKIIDMKNITVQLSDDLEQQLQELSTRQRKPVEQAVTDILRQRLMADRFRELCRESQAMARAAGYTSEDQILREIS